MDGKAAAPGKRGARNGRSMQEQARLIIAGVLGALIVLFAALNAQDVEVDWILTTTKTPLIVVMIVFALAGTAAGWLLARHRARRR
jgi:uncharacterized integral membrane protein